MRTFIAAALLATTLLPSAAHARQWELSGGTAMHVFRSPSLDAAATSDVVALGDLGGAVRLTPHAPILGNVWLEVRYLGGLTSAVDFGLYRADLSFLTFQTGLRAARQVLPRVHAFAHFDIGVTRGSLRIADPYGVDRAELADSDWAASWSAGLGADLAAFESQDTGRAFGLRLELGWHGTGALDFVAKPDHADDDIARLETIATPLGRVDADGVVVRVGIFGRF